LLLHSSMDHRAYRRGAIGCAAHSSMIEFYRAPRFYAERTLRGRH